MNSVWLYTRTVIENKKERVGFFQWCVEQEIEKILLHFNAQSYLDGSFRDEAINLFNIFIEECNKRDIEVHATIGALSGWTLTGEQGKECRTNYCTDFHGISSLDEAVNGKSYLDPTSQQVQQGMIEIITNVLVSHPKLSGIHLDFLRYYYYYSRWKAELKSVGHNLTVLNSPKIVIENENNDKVTYFRYDSDTAYNDPPIGNYACYERKLQYCYCPRCLKQFQEKYNVQIPLKITGTDKKSKWIHENVEEKWFEFRGEVITEYLGRIRELVNKFDKMLSATIWYNAPYGNKLRGEAFTYNSEYTCFGQKWWDWVELNLVDFLCPMNYWLNAKEFETVMNRQKDKANNKDFPLYSGIITCEPDYVIDKKGLEEYIEKANIAGFKGVCYFNYSTWRLL